MDSLYGAIDLHSNNNYVCVINQENEVILAKGKVPNRLDVVLSLLAPFREQLAGVVVESTFNWYWLVDGLMEAGYQVQLANPAANHPFKGLKHVDDRTDAMWLANLLRLKSLRVGYIYPRQERYMRDLARKRMYLVRQRTSNILSAMGLLARHLGTTSTSIDQLLKASSDELAELFGNQYAAQAIQCNLAVIKCLTEQIKALERTILKNLKLRPGYQNLMTVDGIGQVLALTILLETGDINRFEDVGNFASYCRCVSSIHKSNDKKKGVGNKRNGNKFLAWAFIEAAAFAVRYNDAAKSFFQRKTAKTNSMVARKAVAHKLARACYHIMKNNVPFDNARVFAM